MNVESIPKVEHLLPELTPEKAAEIREKIAKLHRNHKVPESWYHRTYGV